MTAQKSATLRRPHELAAAGLIAPADIAPLEVVAARYAVAITPEIVGLVDPRDDSDPIARQFVPDARELHTMPQESGDPIGDHAHEAVEGVVHRYPDRVLLKLVHVCPVYCRFCFRREMVGPGQTQMLSPQALDDAMAYIAAHAEIWEVVITGGDPLILSPRRIRAVVERLRAIAHVKVIRWHSRVPVVMPRHIDAALIDALRCPDKAVYVVLHANHVRELTPEARSACARLVDNGIVMLSQSVLLRGVNDTVEALGALMRGFVETRIKPYYLHHGDLAPVTAHFRTSISEGQALVKGLRGHYSGLCQPTYVLDIPGGHGKTPLTPPQAERIDGEPDRWHITDFRGNSHLYPPPLDADSGDGTL